MAEAIYDALGQVLTRWTMGSAAAPVAQVWRAEIGEDPIEAELRLLALSGQFLGMAVIAEPPADLRALPDLPALALPTLPDAARSLARRVLAAGDARHKRTLAQFAAGRGWTLHPADWMPAASEEEVPDVYAPWRDWIEAAATGSGPRGASDRLTAANWEDFWPAARTAALAELRRRDPGAARVLLETRLPGEGADTRLRLLGQLTRGLSDADAPFLETLAASDRAPKVKALAAALLARLGRGSAVGEEATELAGFFTLGTKGLLRRSRTVAANVLKTHAQRIRRQTLFAGADYTGFAAALGMSGEELAAIWVWGGDVQADIELAGMAERSASDAIVADLSAALAEHSLPNLGALLALASRIGPTQRASIAQRVLRAGGSYQDALAVAGGGGRVDGVTDMPAEAALLHALGGADARPGDHAPELQALGMLASRAGAQKALERLVRGLGLLQADPRLDMLRLNAALEDRGVQG
jgi:hypothetical protein